MGEKLRGWIVNMRRTTCPQCRRKLGDGERIHTECVSAWADTRAAKAERAQAKAIKTAAKEDRELTKRRKEKLKGRQDWAKDAQTAFNAFIRSRDEGQPCISCGRHHQGQYHAGHYLSVGARPELRYTEINAHRQCAPCNNHLSGNAILFRVGLIKKIGVEAVEWLEGPHELPKWSIDDYREIRDFYREKLKSIKS